MKNKHRIKQGLALLLAGGIALTNLGAALPAFAEDAPATPETASAVTPETAEADTTAPNLVQITENLYNDLPSEMAVPLLSVIRRYLGKRLLGVVIAFCRSCRYAL